MASDSDALPTMMPSNPIGISVIAVTPLSWQSWYSLAFIPREAPVMSGKPRPTPAQNRFMPPPVPVASTTGVGYSVFAPKFSATVVENGKTVEEPTMRRP